MTELEILRQVFNASGKNDKRKILEDNKDNKRLGELLDASLNFFRKFHIHKFDISDSALKEVDMHDKFMQLLHRLENRVVTGNDAKSEVEAFFNKCSDVQQDWYARVLRKDLKIGVSVDTAAKYFDIPVFDVQLAKDGKECNQLDTLVKAGVWTSPKFDGYRCLTVIDDGEVTMFSRNGSAFTNFPKIQESLAKSFKGMSLVLDGEIMSDNFQAMQKTAFAAKRGTTVGDVKYHVFDYLPLSEWKTGKFLLKKSMRYDLLLHAATCFDENVEIVMQELVTSKERILELEIMYIGLGFEGVMGIPDIPYYKGKKSNRLMKFKTMQSQDCKIIGMYEGKEGTRLQGMMGGLNVVQENGKLCECGTGFSDEDRQYMWDNHEEFVERIAEIKYQELSPDGIMRFPVFMRFRDQGKGTGKI